MKTEDQQLAELEELVDDLRTWMKALSETDETAPRQMAQLANASAQAQRAISEIREKKRRAEAKSKPETLTDDELDAMAAEYLKRRGKL